MVRMGSPVRVRESAPEFLEKGDCLGGYYWPYLYAVQAAQLHDDDKQKEAEVKKYCKWCKASVVHKESK